jgi:hypothetical protein
LVEFSIVVLFAVRGKNVTGTFTLYSEECGRKIKTACKLHGGFLHGSLLHINFTALDERQIHFGSAIMELNTRGISLSGKYTSYGKINGMVVSGIVKLDKTA